MADGERENFGDANEARNLIRIANDNLDAVWSHWLNFLGGIGCWTSIGGLSNFGSNFGWG